MSEKSIWDKFELARKEKETLHDYQVKQAPLDIWRSEAEAEWNALLQNYRLADFAARKAQGKLEECQNSMYDFVMQHREDIELHMEDYELLEPILRQILEFEKTKED